MRFVWVLAALCGSLFAQEPKNLDLYLLIGQSNMAGRGAVGEAEKTPIPGIWVQNKDLTWRPATDPLHYDKPTIVGAGLGRPFAQAVRKAHPDREIGLIPAAFGGSALDEWKPGTTHYTEAVRRTKSALKNGTLKGILWHQGEADSGKEELARTYVERFSAFIRQLRADLDAPDVPVVVGEIGHFFRDKPVNAPKYASVVMEQLRSIPAKVPRSAFVSAEGLKHKGDDTHFDTPSLIEFGQRYAAAFLRLEASR